MRIIFTTESIKIGGKEHQLMILAHYLIELKYDVFILVKRVDSNNFLERYPNLYDRIIVYDASLKKRYNEFKRVVRDLEPEFVITFDTISSIFALLTYKGIGFKYINFTIRHGVRLFKPTHFLRSFVCLLSPYLVANSFAGLRANNIKIKRGRFVLYNGIETSFEYNYGIEKKDELRKKLIPSSNNGSIIFLSVANFVKNKDYRTVFKALSELADINYLYLIIGSGPYENDIKKDINRLKLDNKVIILGNKLNVVDYLAISNCFIHSSKGEGCSNAILEAMFNHLPIIATDSGGTSEIVFSETSTLFKYKDYKSLSKYLLDYSKTDLKIFSTAEYTKHMQQFSVQSMVSNFTQILNEVEFIEKIGKA